MLAAALLEEVAHPQPGLPRPNDHDFEFFIFHFIDPCYG
jgi:triphosphoribosyl-dephospho-CoA synthetase